MSDLVYINHKMLKHWRKRAHISIVKAAKGICDPSFLMSAEAGNDLLTWNQFYLITNRYNRPVTAFYLENPPSFLSEIQDKLRKGLVWFISLLIKHFHIDAYEVGL